MFRRLALSLCLSALFAMGLPIAASRADQQPAPKPAAGADSEGFVPERLPATMSSVEEGISAPRLVGAAYGFIWAAVLVYVGFTAYRARQLEQEIAQLSERLSQTSGGRAG